MAEEEVEEAPEAGRRLRRSGNILPPGGERATLHLNNFAKSCTCTWRGRPTDSYFLNISCAVLSSGQLNHTTTCTNSRTPKNSRMSFVLKLSPPPVNYPGQCAKPRDAPGGAPC